MDLSKIYLSSPHLGTEEFRFVQQAFNSNWIAPLGPNVNGFEAELSDYLGGKHHVACLSSGTAAIHLALQIIGVNEGDCVICQTFTFCGSANPVLYQGAIPIFVDSENSTWNICPIKLEEAIENQIKKGKKPKAIIAVHLYGMPYMVNEIGSISRKYEIPVIEDAAESLGSSVNKSLCGTFGDFGILSFNGNKIITTSGGGAIITKTAADKNKAVFLSTQAREKEPHYEHKVVGYNYRMSNVLAGIGRGQLKYLNERVSARRKNYEFYKSELKNYFEFLDEPKDHYSNRWLSCIVTKDHKNRERIRKHLSSLNIESRPLWKPMHLQPVFKNYPVFSNGISESLFEKGLCLPSGSNLTLDDLTRVVNGIKDVV